ncbi:MAG: uroporphyrinogen-III C-methyltransferase [Candidatus Omnitrophica bacterium]|nr:uroporphyrinogen-III C-methyltransferase [Candidatus Omnitrophota bacterium]
MNSPIKIGSRQSPLAKIQVQEILSSLEIQDTAPLKYEYISLTTQGDIDKKTSLTTNPADNFFTNTLDEALLKNQIDIAIHSAKDLPQKLPEGLKIYALTKSLDETDSWVSSYALEELPAGAKVGTSSLLRGEMIRALNPNVILTDIRGTIHERLEILNKNEVDGLIIATCALKRLGLENHIKSILPWEAAPLQGQLAVVGRENNWDVEKLFERIDIRRQYGPVYLIGAGPGDPELITIKATKILRNADCVFYDYLVDPSLLKYAPHAEHIYVGKRKGNHSLTQEKLSRLLKEKAIQGKKTVRLKGGDPLIFGRGSNEIHYLRSYHIPVHVVPGISSATGIPSSLGIPLTARHISSSVAFVSGHGEYDDTQNPLDIHIPQANTIVFLMGLTKLNSIVHSLIKTGWAKTKPIMVISNGTRPNQEIIQGTLADIEKLAFVNTLEAPALIIAGDTVNFYQKEPQKVLLHCGTNPEKYTHYGHIIPWPMIQIQPVIFNEQDKHSLINDFDESDFVILTSPNAVEYFMKTILGLKPASAVHQKIFAVIGRSTAEALEEFGIIPQIVSSQETAEGLFNIIIRIMTIEGKRILLPRSSLPNPFLKMALEQRGAQVKEWTIYNNVKPSKKTLPHIPIDGIIFTSPSTFKNFLEDYGTMSPSWQILAKGPVTAKAIEEAGFQPHMVGL